MKLLLSNLAGSLAIHFVNVIHDGASSHALGQILESMTGKREKRIFGSSENSEAVPVGLLNGAVDLAEVGAQALLLGLGPVREPRALLLLLGGGGGGDALGLSLMDMGRGRGGWRLLGGLGVSGLAGGEDVRVPHQVPVAPWAGQRPPRTGRGGDEPWALQVRWR